MSLRQLRQRRTTRKLQAKAAASPFLIVMFMHGSVQKPPQMLSDYEWKQHRRGKLRILYHAYPKAIVPVGVPDQYSVTPVPMTEQDLQDRTMRFDITFEYTPRINLAQPSLAERSAP